MFLHPWFGVGQALALGLILFSFSPAAASAETVALEASGEVFRLPVRLNGAITLKFVLDSGASDVSIPLEVALTLMHAGTLSPEDSLGEATYRLADGSWVRGQRFLLRSVRVGGTTLQRVIASIGPQGSEFLLGQSLLRRLGPYTIDGDRRVLMFGQTGSRSMRSREADPSQVCDDRADTVFYARHPGLQGYKILSTEQNLAREWLAIRRALTGC